MMRLLRRRHATTRPAPERPEHYLTGSPAEQAERIERLRLEAERVRALGEVRAAREEVFPQPRVVERVVERVVTVPVDPPTVELPVPLPVPVPVPPPVTGPSRRPAARLVTPVTTPLRSRRDRARHTVPVTRDDSVPATPVTQPDTTPEQHGPRWDGMNRQQLREACRQAGISQRGTVDAMRARLAGTEAVTALS